MAQQEGEYHPRACTYTKKCVKRKHDPAHKWVLLGMSIGMLIDAVQGWSCIAVVGGVGMPETSEKNTQD